MSPDCTALKSWRWLHCVIAGKAGLKVVSVRSTRFAVASAATALSTRPVT